MSGSFRLQISQHAIGLMFGELLGSLVATASRSRRAGSDVSVFCIIIWLAYSSVVTVRLSSLLRTIVADTTAYFIMAMALQTLVVLFLSFADVRHRPLSVLTLLTHSILGYYQPIPTYVRTLSPGLWSLTNSWDLIVSMQCNFPGTVGVMHGSLTPVTISLTPILINRVVLSLKKTADNTSRVNQAWNTTHFTTIRFEPRVISGITVGQRPDDLTETETLSDTNDHYDIPLDDLIQHGRARSPARNLAVAS